VDEPMVGLADTIRSLRAELSRAMQEGEGQELRFKVDPVELEFELAVTSTKGGGGGIKFWVVTAEAKLDKATATTHRIKLSLKPLVTTAEGEETDAIVAEQVTGRPK
jgi:Trypsin-co-occurring domain 2